MPLKETIESVVRNLRQGRYPNEQSISFMVVGPILSDLDWDTRNPDFVWPEYSVKNGRVDYALCFPAQHPKVFVEVKINRSKSACTEIWRKRSIIKQFGRLIST